MQKDHSRKQLGIIVLIVFLGFLGISMPYLIFPALFLNPAYSIFPASSSASSHALFLGITLAAYPLGQFVGSPILGSLSDQYGRKKILSMSLFIAAFCNLLTGVALEWESLSLIILGRFTSGLMEGNIAIARAMAADIKSLSKHSSFGKINAAASIAYFLGPLLGGLLTDREFLQNVTSATPFYVISILFIALAILSALILQDGAIKRGHEHKDILAHFNLYKKLSLLFKNIPLKFFLITSTLFTLSIDIFYEFGPVYLTVQWMLTPVQLISYNTVLCLALTVGNGWLAAFSSKHYESRPLITMSIGGLALFLIGVVITDQSYLILLLFALSGLVIGLGVTLLTVKISDSVSERVQAEVMGVQLSLRVLGDAIICLLGGVLLVISSKLILICAALLSFITMLFYAFARKFYIK